MDDFTLGKETGNVEIFRINPDGEGVKVFACDISPDRLARACATFLEWYNGAKA